MKNPLGIYNDKWVRVVSRTLLSSYDDLMATSILLNLYLLKTWRSLMTSMNWSALFHLFKVSTFCSERYLLYCRLWSSIRFDLDIKSNISNELIFCRAESFTTDLSDTSILHLTFYSCFDTTCHCNALLSTSL